MIETESLKKRLSALYEMTTPFAELKYSDGDHFGFILIVFLKRFREHCKSIMQLDDQKDSLLIIRSVLEGEIILRWICSGNSDLRRERSLEYQNLLLVEMTKRFEKMEKPEKDLFYWILKQGLYASSTLFTAKEYNDLTAGDPLGGKTFLQRLTQRPTITEMFEYFDFPRMYTIAYHYLSGYAHWNPLQMGMGIDGQKTVHLKGMNYLEHGHTLVFMYLSLIFVSKQVSLHFLLHKEDDLEGLKNAFMSEAMKIVE